jgi:CheY-like chemotaxis protein
MRLVDDLLDVARIMHGKITLREEEVCLATVVDRAVDVARPLIDERGHALAVAVPDEPTYVRADPARLEQILGNLLTNAAKYTDPGGELRVSVERDEGDAVLRVRDNGIGLAPEMLSRVFDLFTQTDATLARTRGGLGVGLTIARRLVEQHGGRIEARSEGLGKGSEFVMRLPALPARGQPRATSADVPFAPTWARILLAEDNVDAADALMLLLQVLGHEVEVVHDGPSALAALRAKPPDVALIDIGLPGMDGYEVAKRIRALSEGQAPLLVALTGYGRDEDRQSARAAGFDLHLTKPVELDALRALMVQVGSAEAEKLPIVY